MLPSDKLLDLAKQVEALGLEAERGEVPACDCRATGDERCHHGCAQGTEYYERSLIRERQVRLYLTAAPILAAELRKRLEAETSAPDEQDGGAMFVSVYACAPAPPLPPLPPTEASGREEMRAMRVLDRLNRAAMARVLAWLNTRVASER